MAHTPLARVDRRPLMVHVITAKLAPDVLDDLVNLVEKQAVHLRSDVGVCSLELTANSDRADVIITAIRTRPRLERHIRWEVAKKKSIVSPDWLRDSVSSGVVQPHEKYVVLGALFDDGENSCQKSDVSVPLGTLSADHGRSLISPDLEEEEAGNTDLAAFSYLSNYSCQRSSPLACPNQALVQELDIIRRARHYEGDERSALSYARAIASIKAYPYHFDDRTLLQDIAKLPYLGAKLTTLVSEFIQTGKIAQARSISSSTRFTALSIFNTVHGIGPHTARHLYSLGLRTIEDLEKYYEVSPGTSAHESIKLETHSKEVGVEKSIQISLILRNDFDQRISRPDAEDIDRIVMRELEFLESDCKSIIVGGYRRGKQENSDVDIVISNSDWGRGTDKVRGLCEKLVQRLHERGLVKHVLNMSGYHPHDVFRTHHRESLEKALTVFVLPSDPARKQVHARVDLIFTTPGIFWTAVVGWTGSTMFERDLRRWAKQEKGLKFDSCGIIRRHDSKLFLPTSEREVFEFLGLPYVHPILRNADL